MSKYTTIQESTLSIRRGITRMIDAQRVELESMDEPAPVKGSVNRVLNFVEASPDVFDALEDLLEQMEAMQFHLPRQAGKVSFHEKYNAAKAAIAKAKGQA